MKIPKQFELFGRTIHVEYQDDLARISDALGRSDYSTDTITLQNAAPGYQRSLAQIEQTFFHEMVHFILQGMNSKLQDDENFIDLFASCLHQVLVTSKYE